MKADKQNKAYAKSLFKLCLEGDAISEERLAAVLATLERNPPRRYIGVLKAFLAIAKREVADRTAAVEFAGAISPVAIESIRSKLSAAYGRSISVATRQNDALIAGIRVRVGCDVYDASIAGVLHELQSSLS